MVRAFEPPLMKQPVAHEYEESFVGLQTYLTSGARSFEESPRIGQAWNSMPDWQGPCWSSKPRAEPTTTPEHPMYLTPCEPQSESDEG